MRRALLAAAVLCALSAGCGKFRKNRECTDLAQKVNAFIDESQRANAATYAESPEVARESRKLAEQAAAALEGAAVALEKKDLELARTRRRDFDRAAKQEPALVKAINDVCSR